MCWWAFTGLAHILLEGPVLLNPNFFTKENPNFVDELFKEYSRGDSRYIARDTGIIALVVIMVGLKGPASLLALYAVASGKSYSHILQFAVSVCHLYGCLFYFTTAYLAGFNLWASPFYFWAYFIVANSPWAVAPALIATRSWKKICAAAFQAEKVKTR
ncbi:unnamed protein product [Urochloa humidicola]